MNVLIVGGFLGSGKTSLIEQIARYIANRRKASAHTEVVIIENEIGDISIDGQYLKTTGIKVENLFAGCACCTLSGETADALNRLKKEVNPQWVILELSGVAVPDNIIRIIKKMQIVTRTCIIVDGNRWERIRIPLEKLLQDQLQGADIVLLNKTDLIKDEEIKAVECSVISKSRHVMIRPTSLLTTLDDELIEEILGKGGGYESTQKPCIDV